MTRYENLESFKRGILQSFERANFRAFETFKYIYESLSVEHIILQSYNKIQEFLNMKFRDPSSILVFELLSTKCHALLCTENNDKL